MDIECKTTYFEQQGIKNTDATLRLAKERAEQLGIRNVVIASYSGLTGVKASELFKGFNLIVVAGVVGFKEPNTDLLLPENRNIIERNGGKVLHAAHSFGTMGRAINNKFNTIQIDEIIAHVLRLFGQGVKVSCEITCMAADAGLIRVNEDAIGIAGSAKGADAAIVLTAANTHTFFNTKIREIICKPRL
jgi:uncharacterized protein